MDSRRGHTELGQEAAVVGLHPFLGQQAVVVIPKESDHFPLEVLPGRLDWTDGRVRKDLCEVTRERGAGRQVVSLHDDLLTDESQTIERGAK